MKLIGKNIVITGGTSGIGLELANNLKRENNVLIIGRNERKLNELRQNGFTTIKCDMSSREELEEIILEIENQFNHIDVLFNNAGIQHNYLYADSRYKGKMIEEEINVNLTGHIIFTQLMLPLLSNSRKALIVNTTSALGVIPKNDGLIYSVSKAGIRNFTFGLRKSLDGTKINVVEFIPPVTDTKMTEKRNEKKMSKQKLIESILPQLEKGNKIVTVPSIRIFLMLAKISPGLAYRIIAK